MDPIPPFPVPLVCAAMERPGRFHVFPHVVQLPSWCYTERSSIPPRRRRRVLRRRHRWHYSNLPGWYLLLLTLIHVGLNCIEAVAGHLETPVRQPSACGPPPASPP